MTKKVKVLIAIGGTGGHVFPGYNLAKDLINKNCQVELITDKRGFKYIKNFKDMNITILPSKPFIKKNLLLFLYSSIFLIYSFLRSIIHLIVIRPTIIIGMGGYASFPICIAASVLGIKFIIYENNLIIGKANRYLLPFAKKILVSYKELEGISPKHTHKVNEVGNIIKKEIINIPKNSSKSFLNNKRINILVLGGSQAAKVFAEILPNIFKECSNQGLSLKIYQHCLVNQNNLLETFYKKNNIEFETFNFSNNLAEYFSKVNVAITRAGSSVLAELTNACIPFISIPLPSSADDHQLKNAIFYKKRNFGILVEEKDLNDKLLDIIKDIYKNRVVLNQIIQSQSQFSDKNVYKHINLILEKIIDEKN